MTPGVAADAQAAGAEPALPAPATQLDVQRQTSPLPPTPADPDAALEHGGSGDSEYDALVGQTLDGRYYLEHKIGEGRMGVVFHARHAVIERPLAIKVLRRDATGEATTTRRFVQEAKAASRIGHPNIVDITDFGTTPDGMIYSVMEFLPGQTLGMAIRLGAPFAPPRALRITAQIARALAAAHDKGIVHRDLKPANVFLLDRDGRPDFVKIVDFGIAKVTPASGQAAEPRLTRAGAVFGTPEYMAPEQAAGRSDTDGQVDIYALGVILYEMICGRVPHRGDSVVRTLAMQMLDPIPPPSEVRPDLAITPELEAVVMRALAKARDQRYQMMGELIEAIEALDVVEAIRPPATGQGVTGRPMHALAPPHAADPGVGRSPPAAPPLPSEAAAPAPAPLANAPPAVATTHHIKSEPAFTTGERPPAFQHLLTEALGPARNRRWPPQLVLMIAGGAAGAVGIAIALALLSRGTVGTAGSRDAGVVAVPVDAGAVQAPADAAPAAAELIARPTQGAGGPARPAGRHGAGAPSKRVISSTGNSGSSGSSGNSGLRHIPSPGIPDTPNHRGTIQVQVHTQPEGASLYDGTHYRGLGGTELEEPLGQKLVITCRQPGYQPGTVEITFRKGAPAALCVMQRRKVCIPGVKNPFDDCEPAPGPAARDSTSLVDPSAPDTSSAPSGEAP